MAFTHGSSSVFKVDDSAGTLRDLSTYTNNIEGLPGSGDTNETTTFGVTGSARTFIRGLNTATFRIAGGYDSTATTGPDVTLSGLRTATGTATFEFGPEGGTTGKVRYTGECFLTSYTTSAPVDNWVTFSAEFQMTGALTKNTF